MQGFSEATWINTALWGSFTLSRIFLVVVTTFKQEHVLYTSHILCFFGTLCGLLTFRHDASGGETVLPSWSLWALTISFGIGIAPSFPNVIGLANRLYPGTFSGLTQSIFGISANAGNGALPGLAGLFAGIHSIGPVSYLVLPLVGVIVMQLLLWALIYAGTSLSTEKVEQNEGRASSPLLPAGSSNDSV